MPASNSSSPEVIAFASGKGGTGKTSFIAALGYALRKSGHKVLLIDADPATDGLSLFVLGPEGMDQVGKCPPESTFVGIMRNFAKTGKVEYRSWRIDRLGEKDHDVSYSAVISGKGLYGDSTGDSKSFVLEHETPQLERPRFQDAIRKLFDKLRATPPSASDGFDYILVDTRGGFAFESTDVVAVADSFIIVTEPTNTNFYQDRNLVDRINSAAAQMGTKPLLRAIIVNKALDPEESSFRLDLEKEFRLRYQDTFVVANDPHAALVYRTQKVIYRAAPESPFAFDSLRAFQQILGTVTSQWPEVRVQAWSNLVSEVDNAIAEHNKKVDQAQREMQQGIEECETAKKERAVLQGELANLKDLLEQEKKRQDIVLAELKAQADQQKNRFVEERERDEIRTAKALEDKEGTLRSMQERLQDMEGKLSVARDSESNLARELAAMREREKIIESNSRRDLERALVEHSARRTLQWVVFAFFGVACAMAMFFLYTQKANADRTLATEQDRMKAVVAKFDEQRTQIESQLKDTVKEREWVETQLSQAQKERDVLKARLNALEPSDKSKEESATEKNR